MRDRFFLLFFGILLLSLAGCSQRAPSGTALSDQNSAAEAAENSGEPALMIYAGGACLSSAGRDAVLRDQTAGGTISSVIAGGETPKNEGEANFDCLGAGYVILGEGAAALELNGSCLLFLAADTVEYEGIYRKKKDLSEDTLKWLDFYYSLPEKDRDALVMVPDEFADSYLASAAADAAQTYETSGGALSYLSALTDEELSQTEALAQHYFTEEVSYFEGVDQIYAVDADEETLYQNNGIESAYAPGNLIIYRVLTVRDRRDGSAFRTISIARSSKSDDWKIINSGY